jgi:hypothetical protein
MVYGKKKNIFNETIKRYDSKWRAHIRQKNMINDEAAKSPSQYLSQLVAHYRYDSQKFYHKTPQDIAEYISDEFYNNVSYNGVGLYRQYLSQASNEWSQKELHLWTDCVNQYLQPSNLGEGTRDLASDLDDPLFSCVEEKTPGFIQEVVDNIQKNNFEGCRFFTDEYYNHYREKFHSSLNKLLKEKILQRKLELKKYGEDVLIGQVIKDKFLQKMDPVSIYVNCFQKEKPRNCYNNVIKDHVTQLLKKQKGVSKHYQETIKNDMVEIFSFDKVASQTSKIGKRFITPYYSQVRFQSKNLWETCKKEGMFTRANLNYPLDFTGGKYFVNKALINCVNDGIGPRLENILAQGAFHWKDHKKMSFKLNTAEKEFALSFLKGKFIQVLNNILDEDVNHEHRYLENFFANHSSKALYNVEQNGEELLKQAYSKSHYQKLCLEKVQKFYPKNYFFHSAKKLDDQYGRKICSEYLAKPKIQKKTSMQFAQRLEQHKQLVQNIFKREYNSLKRECNKDYPVNNAANFKNKKELANCLESAFNTAISETLHDWQGHSQHKHFKEYRSEIFSHLTP